MPEKDITTEFTIWCGHCGEHYQHHGATTIGYAMKAFKERGWAKTPKGWRCKGCKPQPLSLEDLSEYELSNMRHALGLNYKSRPYRNNFYDDANDPCWNGLVEKGFAIKRRGWEEDTAYFKLTLEGARAVYGKRMSEKFYNEL